jgi:RimJ/RimL family protein N-acetyltransferase
MDDNLLRGCLVRLSAEDPEPLAAGLSRWWRDSEFFRLLSFHASPMFSPKHVREWLEKELEKNPPEFYLFGIRTLDDDKLIGFMDLGRPSQSGNCWVGIGLGERDYWGKGYGTDAMQAALRFAFMELNLQRVTLNVFDYNARGVRSYEKAGFEVEGRVREAILRDGVRHDVIFMGVLRENWLQGTAQSSLRHLRSTAGRLALAQHPRGAAGSRPERGAGAGGRQGISEPEGPVLS